MREFSIEMRLKFEGHATSSHQIDLYDLAQSLIGFQRSLALTSHLVLNDEVITQAPALKGAVINAIPFRPGSWEIYALITATGTGLYTLAVAPKDTPLGHLISSAYDYVIKQSLGFHVDYSKSLGQQYEEVRRQDSSIKTLGESRFDSVIEKCQSAIKEIHRPISASRTATKGVISSRFGQLHRRIGEELNEETYDYIHFSKTSEYPDIFHGWISSFNINTFMGRIYVTELGRPIPFTLTEVLRNRPNRVLVTFSLSENAKGRIADAGQLWIKAFVVRSRSDRIKRLIIIEMTDASKRV